MTQTTAAVDNSAAGVLTGKTAIVTGAPRSIGQAIAVALADKGAQIVVHYRSRRDQTQATVETLRLGRGRRDRCRRRPQLSDSSAVAALFDQAHAQLGGTSSWPTTARPRR